MSSYETSVIVVGTQLICFLCGCKAGYHWRRLHDRSRSTTEEGTE